MSDQQFQQVVTRLLTMINIPHDRLVFQPAYTVSVDEHLNIDLIGLQTGFINLRAVMGTLPGAGENAMMRRLLHANDFAFEHPPVTLGIDPETAAITIWSRQALSELRDDDQCHWFDRFIRIASAVQAWRQSEEQALALAATATPTNPAGRRPSLRPDDQLGGAQ